MPLGRPPAVANLHGRATQHAATTPSTEDDYSASIRELEKSLPFLPGHTFDIEKITAPNHRKSHAFDYCNTVSVFKSEAPGIAGKPLPNQEKAKIHTSVNLYPHSKGLGENVPTWVAFDRKVLRFYAYFQEAVHEKREEQYRVRKVNIYFYLEDDTIHVSEPKTPNSGIPQGTLIRRHRIPRNAENGQHYIISDLNVEKEVTFYARTFKIVGCDEFTREFLTHLGISVPPATPFPPNPYDVHRLELLSRMKATRPCPPKTSLKKFLENDRRVLRFYCIWDDTNSVFGDVRHMVVHYYLSDDTIEIRESIPPNSGRESNTLFLRRCRLPKKKPKGFYGQLSEAPEGTGADAAAAGAGTASHYIGATSADAAEPYFSERDLTIGAVLHLNGRPFVICDCDEFTREYYREKYGLEEFDPVRLEDYEAAGEDNDDDAAAALVAAAAAGGAAHGAAAASAASLIPSQDEPPRPDFRKMMAYDGVALRYSAVLATGKQVDRDRRFVISLFPSDDAIAVFEPHQRNSGIIGGKFLERKRIKAHNQDRFYDASDFAIGAQLTFHNHPFIITGADDYAVKFMDQHPEQFPKHHQKCA
ncbi:hypothetical protein DFJ73DRAFT_144854 [Zopfochytrium polystomum]|nr:hypothetical protein DFJ73DRAFT_144854 [Zopfochytrium polystomum]